MGAQYVFYTCFSSPTFPLSFSYPLPFLRRKVNEAEEEDNGLCDEPVIYVFVPGEISNLEMLYSVES